MNFKAKVDLLARVRYLLTHCLFCNGITFRDTKIPIFRRFKHAVNEIRRIY